MNNEILDIAQKKWGGEIKRANLIYPNEHIIRFVKSNFENIKDTTVLDFGCGAGRDTIALLNEGYSVIAIDYTDEAVEITRDKCVSMGLENYRIIKNIGLEIPVDRDSVDAVVADGSIFYNSRNDITRIVSSIRNVMKTGALFWADFRTREDSLYGKGEQIEDGLFRMGSDTGREGLCYYFATESDIRHIYENAGLEIVSLDEYFYTSNNRENNNSWYHVVARK